MPEVETCAYCKKAIKADDGFVKVEPAAQDSKQFGAPIYPQYAHAKCHEQMVALARPDLEDYILKVREWDETGRKDEKLLAEILELQAALGIKPPKNRTADF